MFRPFGILLSLALISVVTQQQACKKSAAIVINPEKSVWQTISTNNLPEKRHECSFVSVNGKGYLVGGRGILGVEAYNFTSKSWNQLAAPAEELHHFQAVVFNNEIWLLGGFTGGFPGETPVANIKIFNPSANGWRDGVQIPAGRRRGSAGAFVYNSKVYMVGGITNGHLGGHVSWFDEFDPANGQWKQLADAPQSRDHFQAAVIGGKLYLAGGRRSSQSTGQLFDLTVAGVDVYDFATQTWATLPADKNIPTQRAGCTATVLGNQLIIIGGESGKQSAAHKECEAYDVTTGKWTALNGLIRGRHGTQALLHDNKIYIAAGSGNRGGDPELNSMEFFSDK